jgi:hypothetical protein
MPRFLRVGTRGQEKPAVLASDKELRGLAFHDDEGHGDLFGKARLSGNSPCQNFNGLSAHLITRHPNRGQPRKKLPGKFRIAVSRDRDVLRDFPTAPMTFLNAADGEHIARKEHGVDTGIAKFEDVQCLGSSGGGNRHLDLKAFRNGHVPAFQGLSIPDAPLLQAIIAMDGS